MIGIIILFISTYLDGFLTLFLPYMKNSLTLFTPMFTLVSIFIVFPLYRKKEKQYLITVGLLGFIYDLLYTNLLFYDAIIYFLLGLITIKVYKRFDVCHIKVSLYVIILLIIYEFVFSVFIALFNLVPITIYDIYYKIIHSLLLNVIYAEFLYTVIKKIPNKYKRIKIN